MNTYTIYYFSSCAADVNDIIMADSKLSAIKQFIILTKGKYFVSHAELLV